MSCTNGVVCPTDSSSLYLCHSGIATCYNKNAASAHINHGDDCCVDACCSNCAENSCAPPPPPPPTKPPTPLPTTPPTPLPTTSPTAAPTPLPTTSPTPLPTKSPTAAPTPLPTTPPTPLPTKSPTALPTKAPTSSPTKSPTSSPTNSPTPLPTTAPPVNVPTLPPTPSPTGPPTSVPTSLPTPSPTSAPTSNPTKSPSSTPSSKPTPSPTVVVGTPTKEPSSSPSLTPSFQPTKIPTQVPSSRPSIKPGNPTPAPTFSPFPSKVPSRSPTLNPEPTSMPEGDVNQPSLPPILPLQQFEVKDVTMELTGVQFMTETNWQIVKTVTEESIKVELLTAGIITDLVVDLTIKEQKPRNRMLMVDHRSLQEPIVLIIVYDVTIYFRSQRGFTNDDMERFVLATFDAPDEQKRFIEDLIRSGDPNLENAGSVIVTLPASSQLLPLQEGTESPTDSSSPGLIIGLVLVGVVIFALLGFLIYRRKLRKSKRGKKKPSVVKTQAVSEPDMPKIQPEVNPYVSEVHCLPNSDISTLGDPIGLYGDHLTADNETATLDYDFKKFQAGSQSVAGSKQTAGEFTEATSDIFNNLVEDRIDVNAPQGTLGLVLEAGVDGAPFVYEIREGSVVKGQVQVGDRLLSVDGVDLSIMRTGDVYRVIASKKDNPVRQFVFARPRISGSKSGDSQGWNV